MLILSKMFSLQRVNIYLNITVVLFLIIFLQPSKNEKAYTIRNNNYHTHRVKETTKYGMDTEYVDLSVVNPHRHHVKEDDVVHSVQHHSHEPGAVKIPKLKKVRFHDDKNIYEAKYDLHLLYLIKALVVFIVLLCTVIFHAIF